jgi:peptidoglycan/LPS O-acetylase OafA/YrhL
MRRLSRRGLILAAGVFIAAANAMLVYYGLAHTPVDRVIWQNTFVQFEMFAAGILLAIFTSTEDTWLTSPIARSAFAASVPIIWVITESCTHIKLRTQNAMGPVSLCMGYALVASSCALLIYAFLGSNNWPKWLMHMGKVSYGLYVFHVSAIKAISHITLLTSFWAREILTLGVISTLALLSYRFFETPFLKMKQRLEVIPSRPVEID